MRLAVGVCACLLCASGYGQGVPSTASNEEQIRVAMARLSLYSIHAMEAEEADVALAELFDETRVVLHGLLQDEVLDEDLRQFVLSALLFGCRFEWSDQEADPPWLHAQRRLALRFVDAHLGTVVSTLYKITSVGIAIAPEAADLADRLVTVRIGPDVTLEECLRALTSATGVTFRIEGGAVILILPDDRPESMADVLRLARETVTILGILGREAVETGPVLERLVVHPDPQIAARAKAALRQVRGG